MEPHQIELIGFDYCVYIDYAYDLMTYSNNNGDCVLNGMYWLSIQYGYYSVSLELWLMVVVVISIWMLYIWFDC